MRRCGIHKGHLGSALVLALLTASPAARTVEPFYSTLVPDEATRLRARSTNGTVYDLYSESHALLIGESNYRCFSPSLPGVKTEVGRLADVLHLHRFKVEVHFDLTAAEMLTVVDEFMRKRATVPNARILVYVSGHGVSFPVVRPFGYLLPIDAPTQDSGRQALSASAMPMQMFAAWDNYRRFLKRLDTATMVRRPTLESPDVTFGLLLLTAPSRNHAA